MKNWLVNTFYNLRASYWFIPGVLTVSAILLAMVLVELDNLVFGEMFSGEGSELLGPAFIVDADAARQLLGTIAGSMITVAGTVFSLTLVAMVLASQQYGPRMVENFLRDRVNQTVLGVFVAVFAYSLVVISNIRQVEEFQAVPHLAVLVGLIFGLLSIIALIYYIHHVAESIRAEHIIISASRDLRSLIENLYPRYIGHEPAEGFVPPDYLAREGYPVKARASGYLQHVHNHSVVALARDHNLVIRLERYPGEFILKGSLVATLFNCLSPDDDLFRKVNDLLDVDLERTVEQDAKLLFDKLVETAVRSMSPSINDPISAMMCLDRLTEGLLWLAHHPSPSPYRLDEHGALRVVVERKVRFDWMADVAFTQIRRYAHNDLAVLLHMLKSIGELARQVRDADKQRALLRHANLILEQSRTSANFLPDELDILNRSYSEALAAFDPARITEARVHEESGAVDLEL